MNKQEEYRYWRKYFESHILNEHQNYNDWYQTNGIEFFFTFLMFSKIFKNALSQSSIFFLRERGARLRMSQPGGGYRVVQGYAPENDTILH